MMSSTTGQLNGHHLLEARLRALAESELVRRIVRYSYDAGADHSEAALLAAIAITECSARPADARAIEWLVALPLRFGLLGPQANRWSSRLTVGPFQMQEAPFSLKASVGELLRRVKKLGLAQQSLEEVARIWNGGMAETWASAPYSRVLRRSLDLATEYIINRSSPVEV